MDINFYMAMIDKIGLSFGDGNFCAFDIFLRYIERSAAAADDFDGRGSFEGDILNGIVCIVYDKILYMRGDGTGGVHMFDVARAMFPQFILILSDIEVSSSVLPDGLWVYDAGEEADVFDVILAPEEGKEGVGEVGFMGGKVRTGTEGRGREKGGAIGLKPFVFFSGDAANGDEIGDAIQ